MSDQAHLPPAVAAAPAVSNDARAMMMFEANKKSMGLSYVLWFFLGVFGGHRFYHGKNGTAVAQLLLTIFGYILSAGRGRRLHGRIVLPCVLVSLERFRVIVGPLS